MWLCPFKNVGILMQYCCHPSICPMNFVFLTPPKPYWGFKWNMVHTKITLCKYAYRKGSPFQLFSKKYFQHCLCNASWFFGGILMKLGTKERSCCLDVFIFLKGLQPLDLAFSLKNTLYSHWTLPKPFGGFWWNLVQRKMCIL
jgi:hypothetical protein